MKKFLSILGGVICTVICIFLFAMQISFITFTSVKTVITKNSLSEIIKEVDIKEVISNNSEVTSDVYGLFDSLGFSVEETNKILESDAFKNFLNEYLYNNIDNILNDKDVSMDYNSITNLVNDIEAETNITFQNKEAFLKLVQEKYPEIEKSINISNYIKNNVDENNLLLIKTILGNTITIAFIIIFIITYLVMCLFRWSMYKPLIWYGIITTISSFIMLQAFLAINAVRNLITEESKDLEFIISPILKVIKNKGLIVSLIMLTLGVLMIVAFYFIHKKIKEEEKNEDFSLLESDQPEPTQTI